MGLQDLVKPSAGAKSKLLQNVCLSAFAILLLFLFAGINPVLSYLNEMANPWYYLVPTLVAIAISGQVHAFQGVFSTTVTYRYMGIKGGIAAVLGFSCAILFSFMRLPDMAVILSCAAFGIGIEILSVGWGFVLSGLSQREVLRRGATAVLVAAVTKGLLLLLPVPALVVSIIFLLILSSLQPLKIIVSHRAIQANSLDTTEQIKSMIERNWILFGGFILCLPIVTIIWNTITSGQGNLDALGWGIQRGMAAGQLLAAGAILMLLRKATSIRLTIFYTVIPLICCGFIIAAWFIASWNSGFASIVGLNEGIRRFILHIPIGFTIAILGTLLVQRLVAEIHESLPPAFAFGLFVSLVSSLLLLFSSYQYVTNVTIASNTDAIIRVIYLTVAGIYSILFIQKHTNHSRNQTDPDFDEACKLFSFSKRESEVLSLLLQGWSTAHIAKVMFISLSTVKTHIKRIYNKTGARNRDELLEIMYKKVCPDEKLLKVAEAKDGVLNER